MTQINLETLQKGHEELLKMNENAVISGNDITQIEAFLEELSAAGVYIEDPEQRSLLRSYIRYWASFVDEKTGNVLNYQLQPIKISNTLSPLEQAKSNEEISAEITSTQPNELTSEHTSHEKQPSVNLSSPPQHLPEIASRRELLTQAHDNIQQALLLVETAYKLFTNKGYILPRQFRDAAIQLYTTKELLRNLLEQLPLILYFQQEQVLPHNFESPLEIRMEIYSALEDAEKLILYLEKEDHISRQDVTLRARRLITILEKLTLLFEDNGISV